MGNNSIRHQLKVAIREDDSNKLLELIEKFNFPLNKEIGKHRKRTLIIYSILYKSPKCLKELIKLGNDINIPDSFDQSTPFFLASKFNYVNLMEILLKTEKCNIHSINNLGLNCLDISILRGNYESSLFILKHTDLKIEKSLERYKELNKELECPLFNIDLFYDNLIKEIPIEKTPNFSLPNKRTNLFENKVPDPNESWGHFIKRMGKLELYQPPLIDKDKVGITNSIYMKIQSSLIENEYGVNINLNKEKNNSNISEEFSNNKLIKSEREKGKETVLGKINQDFENEAKEGQKIDKLKLRIEEEN